MVFRGFATSHSEHLFTLLSSDVAASLLFGCWGWACLLRAIFSCTWNRHDSIQLFCHLAHWANCDLCFWWSLQPLHQWPKLQRRPGYKVVNTRGSRVKLLPLLIGSFFYNLVPIPFLRFSVLFPISIPDFCFWNFGLSTFKSASGCSSSISIFQLYSGFADLSFSIFCVFGNFLSWPSFDFVFHHDSSGQPSQGANLGF